MNDTLKKVFVSQGLDPADFRQTGSLGVLLGEVPAERAIDVWKALRAAFQTSGYWPVLRGELSEDMFQPGPDVKNETRHLPMGSVRDLLRKRFGERVEVMTEFAPTLAESDSFESAATKVDASGANSFIGQAPREEEPWPERDEEGIELHALEGLEKVSLALVPAGQPHEVPVLLGFGGWNECPEPACIAAILREWNRAWGAVPIAITGDVMECFVKRPPQSKEQALSLAAEQWIFCDDIVAQGTQTVSRLAKSLWRRPQWFFWWD